MGDVEMGFRCWLGKCCDWVSVWRGKCKCGHQFMRCQCGLSALGRVFVVGFLHMHWHYRPLWRRRILLRQCRPKVASALAA